MKIGVLSDTHGFLDPRSPTIFAGVDHILHAGDVGDPFLAFELEQIAPLTVVLGNTDLGLTFPLTRGVELGGRKFLVQHIVNPASPDDSLKRQLARVRPDVVVFGHTHKPYAETRGGILFFNPGYSGAPKSGAPRSVAIFQCDAQGIRHEWIPLNSK